MTSRVILRRRRIFSDYLNVSARSIQSFQNLGHGSSNKYVDSHNFSSLANQCLQGSDSSKNRDEVQVKEGLLKFTTSGLLWQRCNGFIFSGYSIRKLDLISPTRLRFMSESAHYSSTATEKQPDFGSYDERNEELVAKTRKEASPQDCDEAVVDLSAAKAKPKEKRLQESQKVAMSILKRVWATMLGIGPALRAVASMSREDWAKKLIHWKHEVKSTLQHYWLGTKLLWADVRISSRLLLKLAGGKSLSRRERQRLTRTTADIFRLAPFAVFIIVPFMEFLLPVFLKLFPNMLPSTFQDKMKAEEALVRSLNARIEYEKFFQETAREMAREVKNSCSFEIKKTAEDLDEFLNRVRRSAGVTNEEILGFAKLFNDEPTLDNISRPWLLNMCKYMGIKIFGTDAYLRFMLRKKLQRLRNDDKLIQAEGVDSLSEDELREDCMERGIVAQHSVEEMRQQLRDWLDLSVNHCVPSSLMILSRAFTVSGKVKPEDAVRDTLISLPDEVVDTVGITSLPSEDTVSERRRKLEFLELQEELIKEEEEEEEEVLAQKKESVSSQEGLALEETTVPTAREAPRARAIDKGGQLCEISCALAVLTSASSVSREREEFLRLVNKERGLHTARIWPQLSFASTKGGSYLYSLTSTARHHNPEILLFFEDFKMAFRAVFRRIFSTESGVLSTNSEEAAETKKLSGSTKVWAGSTADESLFSYPPYDPNRDPSEAEILVIRARYEPYNRSDMEQDIIQFKREVAWGDWARLILQTPMNLRRPLMDEIWRRRHIISG